MKGKGDDMAKSNVPAVPALGGEASLNRYLSEIRKFPLLTPEQEYMLAKRYRQLRHACILQKVRSTDA